MIFCSDVKFNLAASPEKPKRLMAFRMDKRTQRYGFEKETETETHVTIFVEEIPEPESKEAA